MDIALTLGALLARFKILRNAIVYWKRSDVVAFSEPYVILHNMFVMTSEAVENGKDVLCTVNTVFAAVDQSMYTSIMSIRARRAHGIARPYQPPLLHLLRNCHAPSQQYNVSAGS